MEELVKYLSSLRATLKSIDLDEVQRIVNWLDEFRRQQKLILVAGNGGSAATASHWVADTQKTILGEKYAKVGLRTVCLTDNSPIITAWSNDEAYIKALAHQIYTLGDPGDLLVVISASGNSPNIVEAVLTALQQDMKVLAFLGFQGGQVGRILSDTGDNHRSVIVSSSSYGVIEDVHSTYMHLITEGLKNLV